jgi:DNA-binding GntR family transcriptional regulator
MQQVKQTPTVGLSTYEAIRNDIIFGWLKPDTKLKLDNMKASYKASISTLRETLNRLASEGFVVAEEQRGFFVAPVSKADLREISDLRILLECTALRQSIENGDTDWEGTVASAHHKLHRMEQQMQSGDASQKELWKRYDSEFHQSLISACGSRNLLEIHGTIYDKYLRYQMQILTYRGKSAANEHKHLFEAALDRDADKADKILRQHIEKGLKHTLEEYEALD